MTSETSEVAVCGLPVSRSQPGAWRIKFGITDEDDGDSREYHDDSSLVGS